MLTVDELNFIWEPLKKKAKPKEKTTLLNEIKGLLTIEPKELKEIIQALPHRPRAKVMHRLNCMQGANGYAVVLKYVGNKYHLLPNKVKPKTLIQKMKAEFEKGPKTIEEIFEIFPGYTRGTVRIEFNKLCGKNGHHKRIEDVGNNVYAIRIKRLDK